MRHDETVVLLGEDVAEASSMFTTTEGLHAEFTDGRVRDPPIAEKASVGAAMAAATTWMRPMVEIMFANFLAVYWDMVANQIAKPRYMPNRQMSLRPSLLCANTRAPCADFIRTAVRPTRHQTPRDDNSSISNSMYANSRVCGSRHRHITGLHYAPRSPIRCGYALCRVGY
jgi:hypothetical protein